MQDHNGGAFHVESSSKLSAVNCTFSANKASDGGTCYALSGSINWTSSKCSHSEVRRLTRISQCMHVWP